MERYLTASMRSLAVLAAAVMLAAGLASFDLRAQTPGQPVVYAFLDDGSIAGQFGTICAELAQIDPTLVTCAQSTPSQPAVSGDASTCLKPAGTNQVFDIKFNDAAIEAAFAAAIAAGLQLPDVTIYTRFIFAHYPVSNSCTMPIYLSVHDNGQWYTLADSGPIAAGATSDIFVALLGFSATTLSDAVLSCSGPAAQGASACPAGAPVAPSGCTLTANPSQLPAGGGSATLTTACSGGDPPTNYAWTGPNVAPTTAGASQKVNVTATSTFTVVASNASGAAPAASATVTVAALGVPICTLSSSPTRLGAGGGAVTLTADCSPAASSFRWTGPGVNPSAGSSQPVNLNAGASFSVVGVNASGSSAAAFAYVDVDTGLPNYAFTIIDYPGAFYTLVYGINNVGQLVGQSSVTSATTGNFSFIYQSGSFSVVPPPPSGSSLPLSAVLGINDLGVMVGGVFNAAQNSEQGAIVVQDEAFASLGGFTLGGAAYSTFAHSGYTITQGRAISNGGVVVGAANNGSSTPGTIGFIYDAGSGAFTDIAFSGSSFTTAQGVNAAGQVVGSVDVTTTPRSVSFLRQGDGTTTTFAINGSATQARGINDAGLITGIVAISGQPGQVFVGNSAAGFRIFPIPGAQQGFAEAINNAGVIVGIYYDAASTAHGFLGTPVTDPAATRGASYAYQAAVVQGAPIFVAPTVASGFAFAIGTNDPAFAAVRLPAGTTQGPYTVSVADQTFALNAGDLFDFRAHGFPNGVTAFSVTGIDTSVFTGAANARAFPIELDFVATGTFTGTQTPLGP